MPASGTRPTGLISRPCLRVGRDDGRNQAKMAKRLLYSHQRTQYPIWTRCNTVLCPRGLALKFGAPSRHASSKPKSTDTMDRKGLPLPTPPIINRVGSHQTQHRPVGLAPRPVAVQPGPHVSYEIVAGPRIRPASRNPRSTAARSCRPALPTADPFRRPPNRDSPRARVMVSDYAGLNPSVAFQVVRSSGQVSSGHSEKMQVRRTMPDPPNAP